MKKYATCWNIFLCIAVFVIDRATKWYALEYVQYPKVINRWISFELMFNRGISWGMLHSSSQTVFVLVTLCIVIMIALLVLYAFTRWSRGLPIVGELLTIAGALSNVIDRVLYGGVIDFIVLTVHGYTPFGVFNVADVCIVGGIFLIFITSYLYE